VFSCEGKFVIVLLSDIALEPYKELKNRNQGIKLSEFRFFLFTV
jgi:hypothetical protein